MNLKKLFLIGLVCVFLAPSSAFDEKGKWSFTPYVGANVATSRDMGEGTTVVTRADTLSDGTILGVGGSVDLKALSFNDTHDARLLTGFDVGYFVSETLELFGGFEYVTANGDTTQLGTVVDNNFTITDTTSTDPTPEK